MKIRSIRRPKKMQNQEFLKIQQNMLKKRAKRVNVLSQLKRDLLVSKKDMKAKSNSSKRNTKSNALLSQKLMKTVSKIKGSKVDLMICYINP
jgi:hypothetical protein